jgi:protein AATF/BFR2
MHSWSIQTLNKWSAKIQAVAPSMLLPSNRNAFSKTQQHVKSAVQLAEETLRDHDKLLSRSRIRRGKERRLGADESEEAQGEEDPDVFDDTDFYQQLLRDVIDSKGVADDWMAVQKEKKAKKKVDTKASKGRKIR